MTAPGPRTNDAIATDGMEGVVGPCPAASAVASSHSESDHAVAANLVLMIVSASLATSRAGPLLLLNYSVAANLFGRVVDRGFAACCTSANSVLVIDLPSTAYLGETVVYFFVAALREGSSLRDDLFATAGEFVRRVWLFST